jgi:pimeloyl-ACP methyl ester carboxylesterase
VIRRFRLALPALIIVSVGGLVAGVAALWLLGSELIRPVNRPVPLPADLPAQVVALPGPGHAIASWWLDRGGKSPAVLLLHSIRADRSSMLSRAKLLWDHGLSVLLIDLQGHGETPGAAITLGIRESADVRAALGWLKQTVSPRRIGVIGCSLGGAAVLLAPQPSGFDAVVLEAVYPRVARAVENRIRIRVGPLAPVLAPLLLVQLPPRLHVWPKDLEPIRSIASLGAPVLVVAGSHDQHTTLAESEELFRTAVSPKRLWVVRGAGHQDFLSHDRAGYESEVVGFLLQYLRTSPSAATDIGRWAS